MDRLPLDFRTVLLHHLDYTFEKEAWQPSLAMALDGVTHAEALWKPAPQRHSIWQIVRHVTHWKQATLDAWTGVRPLFTVGQGETAYVSELERTDWAEVAGDAAAWQADVRALHAVSGEIRGRAAQLREADCLRPFPGEEMPLLLRVLRMATHDIYHAGQIQYLRALWRARTT